ncbi:hypothetical protein [Natrialba sp. INN-245]|uniref:DUF7093 family protein n=1 Tax=Natrialba sp. INN-245 TaxID=2690967 RepID=UPI00131141D7|nr:hypothetical protein [Natrialba sp. INN-245]MWV38539.1 hypothetical protein [Natrialba sp. INN-245]
MVLRCSLLGHAYGEPEVQREREERGSEVVVTVQEFEECVRCGERNVISENTEVTSLAADSNDRSPTDSEPEPTAQRPTPDADVTETADGEPDVAETTPPPDEATSDAVIVDAEPDEDVSTDEPADADPAPASSDTDEREESDDLDVPTDESGEPITDDGEILDEETANRPADDRERGEWPESDDVGPPVDAEPDDATSWPERADDEPESSSETSLEDEPIEDDAIVLEHDESTVDSSSGAEAIATESEILDAADVDTDPATDSGSGIQRAEPAPNPGDTPDRQSEDVPTEFYCPRCDYVDVDDRGSLRAGDICPECRKGYLGERPVQ